jgi:hypothetical protein
MLLGDGEHCSIVVGMSVEQKQLIHASQIAAHKTFFAIIAVLRHRPREKKGAGMRMRTKLEHLLFRSM